ncbi:MAG: hypothetical protein B6D41_09920 [Chloroflexi bacterium UTCFX4]|jgi:hypothetical protein|nr:MAG: hypothetical protein B6D41_09920 [Chloroflexi bacterium UTCFX4]
MAHYNVPITYGSDNGGYRTFGTTDNSGIATRELLPGNPRTFYATVNQTYSAKQTATLANQTTPLVTFTTTKVTLDYNGTIHHGSPNFGWYPFTKPTMEMFAGAHTFLLDSGKPNARKSRSTLAAARSTTLSCQRQRHLA